MDKENVQSIFNELINGVRPDELKLAILKEYLLKYKPPKECFHDPPIQDMPVFKAETLITDASRKYVELEEDGFLLSVLPDYNPDFEEYLYQIIFDGRRKNNFTWESRDEFRLAKGQKCVSARGYENTSIFPGFVQSEPKNLQCDKTFTELADEAEIRKDLPKFKKRPDFLRFYSDFYNAHLHKKVISKIPYLIFNMEHLMDKKKNGKEPMSSFDFRKIENKLKMLGFDKVPGFAYPYVYYYFHCSTAGDHDEDLSTNSFNVNYGEGVKLWRIVTRLHAHRLRELTQKLKQVFSENPDLIEICHLQHKGGYNKQTLIHPGLLALYGIPYKIVVQRHGVGILTSSAALHSVLNYGRGVSVAINLIIPINFLMNPITDLCVHGFNTEDTLANIKILALRDVAKNPPLETIPKHSDLNVIPTGDKCGTRNYILELVEEFDKLECSITQNRKGKKLIMDKKEIGYEFAYYALIRLIRLAGLELCFDRKNKYKFKVKINFNFDVQNLEDTPFPQCPTNLINYLSLPVLIGEYNTAGELVYENGFIESVDEENVIMRMQPNNSIVTINVTDRKSVCKVIGNRVPLENELVIGEDVVYFFQSIFRVGVLTGVPTKAENPYIVNVNGIELGTRRNLLRVIKPIWYESLCSAINRKMVPLCLPEKPKIPITRSSGLNKNSKEKFKFENGELVEFTVGTDGKLNCPKCESNFTQKKSLVEHFYSAHVVGFNAYDCPACHTHISYKRTFQNHNKTEHGGALPDIIWRPPTCSGNYIKVVNNASAD